MGGTFRGLYLGGVFFGGYFRRLSFFGGGVFGAPPAHIAVDVVQRLAGAGHAQVGVEHQPQPRGGLVVVQPVLAGVERQEPVPPAR